MDHAIWNSELRDFSQADCGHPSALLEIVLRKKKKKHGIRQILDFVNQKKHVSNFISSWMTLDKLLKLLILTILKYEARTILIVLFVSI